MITHACVMPAGFGMGDHRLFVVDINEGSIIGQAPFQILRQTSRRLNTKVSSGATRRYIEQLEKGLIQHRIFDCLQQIHHKFKNMGRRAQQALNKLDKQMAELMANAERKCRKIKSSRIPFSPEAAIWIRRTLVYKSLLRYHQGLIRNRGNLNRTA